MSWLLSDIPHFKANLRQPPVTKHATALVLTTALTLYPALDASLY